MRSVCEDQIVGIGSAHSELKLEARFPKVAEDLVDILASDTQFPDAPEADEARDGQLDTADDRVEGSRKWLRTWQICSSVTPRRTRLAKQSISSAAKPCPDCAELWRDHMLLYP